MNIFKEEASFLTPEENATLNEWEGEQRKLVLRSTPIRISMNLTGGCNIRCIYCHLTYAKYYSDEEFDLELLKKIENFLPALSYLVYFSSTEPLFARHFKGIFKGNL